jgi:hypothetical protein
LSLKCTPNVLIYRGCLETVALFEGKYEAASGFLRCFDALPQSCVSLIVYVPSAMK